MLSTTRRSELTSKLAGLSEQAAAKLLALRGDSGPSVAGHAGTILAGLGIGTTAGGVHGAGNLSSRYLKEMTSKLDPVSQLLTLPVTVPMSFLLGTFHGGMQGAGAGLVGGAGLAAARRRAYNQRVKSLASKLRVGAGLGAGAAGLGALHAYRKTKKD